MSEHVQKQSKAKKKPQAKKSTPKQPHESSSLGQDVQWALEHPQADPATIQRLHALYGNHTVSRMLAGERPQPALPTGFLQRAGSKADPGEALPEVGEMAKQRFENLKEMHPVQLKTIIQTAEMLTDNFDEITQTKFDQLADQREDTGDLSASRLAAHTAVNIVLNQGGFEDPGDFQTAINDRLGDDADAKKFVSVFLGACSQEAYRLREQEREDLFGASSATAYAEKMEETIADTPYLDEETRTEFADALKTMPTVTWLIDKDREATDALPQDQDDETPGRTQAAWKNGGSLTDFIKFANYSILKKRPAYTDTDVPPNHKMYRRVEEADLMLKNMVEPDILAMLNPPKVYIVRSLLFRAFQNEDLVHVSKSESMQVIVHEVSHYLEDYLPTDLWADIHAMMRARHTEHSLSYNSESKRDRKLTQIGHGEFGLRGEGRYRGKYGTGKYTSSAYGVGMAGGTEFTSMTMEWLAKPNKAVKLIDSDPQQAAIVLKNMRPNEYNAVDALRPFDEYLPKKASWK